MEKPWLKHYDKGVPATLDYPQITLHRRLEETAKRFPDSTAIIFPGALGDVLQTLEPKPADFLVPVGRGAPSQSQYQGR